MLSKNKGITLVSLVITIIVMLILAGVSLSMVTGDSSVLGMAKKTALTQKLATYQEEFELSKTAARMEGIGKDGKTTLNDFDVCIAGKSVQDYIPSLAKEDYDKVAIFDGTLVYDSADIVDDDKNVINDMGIKLMVSDDYKFLIGMSRMADFVKKSNTKIGVALTGDSTDSENGYQEIKNIRYGLGWYKITTAEQMIELGFEDSSEISFLLGYAPYIVKYSTGDVQSVKGKNMYADTDDEVWKYTFNYTGKGENTISQNNLLSGVTSDSVISKNQFGGFAPTKQKAPSGAEQSVIDSFYKNEYDVVDGGKGVGLNLYTNILSMPIDDTKELNKKVSINVTFKADVMTDQQGKPRYGGTGKGGCLLAISNLVSQDICSIRIRQGYLTVITFRDNNDPESVFNREETGKGYAVIDIKKYNNKYVNVNVVAERDEQTKVYINGVLEASFESGSTVFDTYSTLVIGDLRSGRGMKFFGNVYNFGLYGGLLTEEEVAQNWQYTKKYLGINEAGDKV